MGIVMKVPFLLCLGSYVDCSLLVGLGHVAGTASVSCQWCGRFFSLPRCGYVVRFVALLRIVEQCVLVAIAIKDFLDCQRPLLPFQPIPKLRAALKLEVTQQALSEIELMELSISIQPTVARQYDV